MYEGMIDALPADAPAFDKALSINVIRFLDDKAGFIAKIAAHLKPGAVLATTYQPRHAKAVRADGLAMAARLSEILSSQGSPACGPRKSI